MLYEMLTDERAFRGEEISDVMAAVLRQDIDWTALPAGTPLRLRRLLERCLDRDHKTRLRDIGEARVEIARIEAGATDTAAAATIAPASSRMAERLLWIGALVIVGAVLAAASYFARPAPDLRLTRFSVLPPNKASWGETIAISPDGRHLAFVARADGASRIWVRALDTLAARPLPGTDRADFSVFWSPDSAFLGFFADGKLKKVPVDGGPVQTVCDAAVGSGGTWGHDGVIVFAAGADEGLSRVSAAGGKPAVLTVFDSSRQETSHRWPAFLPDGRHLLYFARSDQAENHAIFVTSVDNPAQRTLLVPVASNALYAPPGFLLFITDRTLMAQPFDAKALKLTGDAFPIAEGVGTSATRLRLGAFSASNNGVLVYGSGTTSNRQFAWFDRSGKELSRIAPVGQFVEVKLSPDGERAAFRQVSGTNDDIWILDLARGVPSRLTFDPGADRLPVWSPDGAHVAFYSGRMGVGNIYQKLASGVGADELMLKSGYSTAPTDWSHDGRFLLYQESHPQTKSDLYALPLFGDRKPVVFLQTEANELQGRFSPDDRWIAYTSSESGRAEVYIQSFPPSGGKAQISIGGGGWPRWRKDGKELFYLTDNRMLMAVPIKNGTAQGVPIPLFEAQVESVTGFNRYDVTADGQRFLVNVPVSAPVTIPLTLVTNWTAGLKK